MPLIDGAEMLNAALKGKYGVGFFSTHNLESTQGILLVAEALKSPVVITMSEGAIRYGGKILEESIA